MIFLRKILSAAVFMTALTLIVSGCSFDKSTDEKEKRVEATSQPFTERAVETASGNYVFDNAGLLDAEDMKACNDYAGWLYSEKLINAAVVTVNDLGGKAPYDYALDEYNRIYEGKGSGLVVLVNNATNEDVVFRTGSCLTNISQKSQENAVYWATKEFIGGDYRKGIMRLLQLGELSPDNIVDNAEVFQWEEITKLEKALSSCDESVMLIASRNGSDTPNEDILKNYYSRRYPDGKGVMLMIDINSKTIIAYSDKELPDKLRSVLKSADELAAKEDYYGAVNNIIESLGGKKAKSEKKE